MGRVPSAPIRLLLALAILLIAGGCGQTLQPLRIASSTQPVSANVYAAQLLGHFEAEGLAVEIRSYPSGKAALEAVLRGRADLATVAETPVMHAVIAGERLHCYASLSESMTGVSVVGRRDLGIGRAADLVDARIALSRGTNAEIYLLNHLRFVNLPLSGIRIVDRMPVPAMQALLDGEVEAVSLWEPHVSELVARLGPRATVLHEDAPYHWSCLLIGVDPGPPHETLTRVLRAIQRSNQDLDPPTTELLERLASAFHTPPEHLRRLMAQQHYRLQLGGNLAVKMELQAIQLHGSGAATAADFTAILATGPLAEVDPAAVTASLP